MHSQCDARYILVMYRLLGAGMVLTCELFLVEINSTLFWLSAYYNIMFMPLTILYVTPNGNYISVSL